MPDEERGAPEAAAAKADGTAAAAAAAAVAGPTWSAADGTADAADGADVGLREPLLHSPTRGVWPDADATDGGRDGGKAPSLLQDMASQAALAWPLVTNLVAAYATSIISFAFVGHLGKRQLAAAALGNSFVGITARYVLQGLCGSLDTLAAQAYGAGNLEALGPIFKRTLLFLWLHCVPISAILLAAPRALQYLSSDDDLASMAHAYILALIPAVWLDAAARPLNRILVAQRITKPQMAVSLAIIPLHAATTYALIHVAGLGYVGAALAVGVSNGAVVAANTAYICAAGLAPRVFGGAASRVFQGWGRMAALSYPAMVMRCAESSAFSAMTVLAARLPDPNTSVAAISVAFSTCAIFYMPYNAFSMTACTQVGNALGAGNGAAARTAALASSLVGPLLWLLPALLLLEPHGQALVIAVFTSSDDPALLAALHGLLPLVAAVSLFDGVQTILTGVIEGVGLQLYSSYVNLAVFYGFAVPLALWLGFSRGLGVVGMWGGMLAGSVVQAVAYGTIAARIRWEREAAKVAARSARA